MLKQIVAILCVFGPTLFHSAFAQLDLSFTRDSIEIEQGVSGTADFEPLFKLINEAFDDQNRPLISVVYRYDNTTTLIPVQRQQFEYDAGNNVSRFTLEDWDANTQAWVPLKEERSNYQGSQLMSFLRQTPVEGVLTNSRRWIYQYNPDGQETQKLIQTWNTDNSSWENLSRKGTTYNADGQIEAQLLQRFQDDAWQNRRLRTWLWMPDELQPSSILMQSWSVESTDWVNNLRKTYSMTPDGLWSGVTTEEWDSDAGAWVNEVREAFTLDAGTNTSFFQAERWNNEEWQRSLRSLYSYTPEQNTGLIQEWNSMDNAYQNFLRFRSTFNEDGLPVQRIGMQVWNTSPASWANETFTRRITYYWSDTSTGLSDVALPSPCRVPNPYHSGAMVNCDFPVASLPLTLELTNLYGQTVARLPVNSNSFQLPTSVPAGLYVLQLFDDQQRIQVEKIIIGQ